MNNNPMQSLSNKRILLGITGGIAAYKAAELSRKLRAAGADVRVAMTKAATAFITPLTLQALTGNPVHTELLDPEAEAGMGHIELAKWADLFLIAPASADFIARLAEGHANDLLTTCLLATNAKIAIAPAMNQQMWANSATQANLAKLQQRGVLQFGPAAGEQACGDVGLGRMLEPNDIADLSAGLFSATPLSGKTVVITAGPTREAIDPVRYISNHSSGKMGYAIAAAAAEAGARTILISGPTQLACPDRVQRININSAKDMLLACEEHALGSDCFIATAAVADYGLDSVAAQKIKKTADTMQLTLTKNPDILKTIANHQQRPQYVVGFAAETNDLLSYARSKLVKKNLDLIIANDVSDPNIGFNSDNNHVHFICANQHTEMADSKAKIGRAIIEHISASIQKLI